MPRNTVASFLNLFKNYSENDKKLSNLVDGKRKL